MLKSMMQNIVMKNMAKKIKNNTITEEDIKNVLREIRVVLLDSDVNFKVIKEFLDNVKNKVIGQVVESSDTPANLFLRVLKEELIATLGGKTKEINPSKSNFKILMIGLQGTGKTTTTSKIASYFKTKHNKNPLMVALDIYRPAAIEQLKTLGNSIDIPVFEKQKQDPIITSRESIDYAREKSHDLIVYDTAGRLQIDSNLMTELVQIKKEVNPDEVLLVVDAMTGQDIVNVAKEFNDNVKLTGLIITKLDSDAKGGAALSLAHILKIPIVFIGTGETTSKLEVFHPERMADRILGLGDIMTLAEKAADVMDEKKAKSQMERMLSGKMDLEDLLQQMETISKMGNLGSLVSMVPGAGKISDKKIEDAEFKMKKWKILMGSMTLKERRNPKLIVNDSGRKIRIIRGSGSKPDDLNKLLSDWKKAQEQISQMGKMMKSGKNPFSGMM